MSITRNNIGDFITFLYRKRKGQEPPAQLIEGWKALSNDAIAHELSGLFRSWGLTDEEKRSEINAFFKETLFPPKTQQQAPKAIPVATAVPNAPAGMTPVRKKRRWPVFLVIVIILLGLYTGYQYMNFSQMNYLYTITDNVQVRDENKKVVARMDLYEVQGNIPSYQKLKAVDNEIYYRSIDNSDNKYPFRKVLLKEGSFLNYLFGVNQEVGYVNTNYVVDNVKEFDLYQTAFKEVKNNKSENADLKAIYRKIIVGSMSQDGDLENKYIALHTSRVPRSAIDATYGILKQTVKENVKYIIVAGLSDGYYYSFEGDIKNSSFSPPQKITLTNADKETQPLKGAYRFMNKDGKVILYDCLTNTPTNYEAEKNGDGKIIGFAYKAPNFIEQVIDTLIDSL
jgi:hypothetical protein